MHCFFFLAIMKYPTKISLKKKVHLGLRIEVIPLITVGWCVTTSSGAVREYVPTRSHLRESEIES